MESCQWTNRSECAPKETDLCPWNLVNCSLFKLDARSIGVLWYDSVKSEKILRASQFNHEDNYWRHILLATSDVKGIEFRLGAS